MLIISRPCQYGYKIASDHISLMAIPWKLMFGTKVVYDQIDCYDAELWSFSHDQGD